MYFLKISNTVRSFGVLLLLPVFLSLNVRAQQPVLKNFNIKDGLPSSEVYYVMQDSKGFMWFCTDAGVSRYDGYSFTNFSVENGLTDNTIFGCCEDKKGRIWFRTFSGKICYYSHDSIFSIAANEKIRAEIHTGLVTSICVDAGDTVWCGVYTGKGYFKIAPPYQKKDFQYITLDTAEKFIVHINPAGIIWGQTYNSKQGDNIENNKIRVYDNSHEITPLNCSGSYRNSVFVEDEQGKIIVNTRNEIVIPGSGQTYHVPGSWFISLYKDNSGGIWAGKLKEGVYCFQGGLPPAANTSVKPEHFLKGLSVTGITKDAEGGIWFTTLSNGVFYMAYPALRYYNASEGLTDNKVKALIARDSSSVWAGLADGKIALFTKDTIIQCVPSTPEPARGNIFTFYKNPLDNSIIVGGSNCFTFPGETKYTPEFISYADNTRPTILCFTSDKHNNLWGANYNVLLKMDLKKRQVTEQFNSPSNIRTLYCDENDTLWIGCLDGLWTFKNGQFDYYGTKHPAFQDRIIDIKPAPDSSLWFATQKSGILIKKGNRVVCINKAKGLSGNLCRNIFFDAAGNAWVGTDNGLNRVSKDKTGNYSIYIYSLDNGVISNEINQVVLTGKKLWVATSQGVVTFNADEVTKHRASPPIYISSLEINSIHQPLADTFQLKHNENFLKINFLGLSYSGNSKINYKYMLEGIDSTWTTTTNTSIQYTTLPSGNYTFKVYAISNAGVMSSAPAILHFIISKPYWKEWWFVLLLFTASAGIITLLVLYRIKLLQQKAAEKAEIEKRITRSELKALRAQINPHFIFNAINSVQRSILKNDSDSANKHLTGFSRLIRKVLENSKYETIPMVEEIEVLKLFVELEYLRFTPKFTYQFYIDENLDADNIFITPMLIQAYIENAIWHGLMHLEDRTGKLYIGIEKENDFLKCVIDDNGIGRKRSNEIKKESKHKSMGMAISREIVETMGTLYETNSKVIITDKMDEAGTAQGTRVEIYIPLK